MWERRWFGNHDDFLIIIITFVLILGLIKTASTTFHPPDPFRFTAADHGRTASRHNVSPSSIASARQDAAQEIRLSRLITSCCALMTLPCISNHQVTFHERACAGSHSISRHRIKSSIILLRPRSRQSLSSSREKKSFLSRWSSTGLNEVKAWHQRSSAWWPRLRLSRWVSTDFILRVIYRVVEERKMTRIENNMIV
jgi:hypothetical protein